MNIDATAGNIALFIDKMEAEGLGDDVIESFAHYYRKVENDEKGTIRDADIDPVSPKDIPTAEDLEDFAETGRESMGKAVWITLNGGLGTSMGLTGPKSLLRVKSGRTFLDLRIEAAKRRGVRLVLMDSFRTHETTERALEGMVLPTPSDRPETFCQSRYPKILRQSLAPAVWRKDPVLEWNPPGHGEIYDALRREGMLEKLVDQGVRYAFVSNSDNLGASIDECILGYFVRNRSPFMMEVTQRRPMDAKGGHLAHRKGGGLLLREIAQCPEEELEAFQDIEKYRFFNTNSLWIDLAFLRDYLEKRKTVRLPMILKSGKLDPRDALSPDVYQIETAMGAAVSLFEGAAAVNVSKDRFIPVKGHNDLLAICSDCFLVGRDGTLVPNPDRRGGVAPRISLDPEFFRKFDMFFDRFPRGFPSLIECESLAVEGDVFFEENVTVRGNVRIANDSEKPATVMRGSVLDRDLVLLP